MLKLRTIYPYGLKEKLDNFENFINVKNIRELIINLHNYLKNDLPNAIIYIRN